MKRTSFGFVRFVGGFLDGRWRPDRWAPFYDPKRPVEAWEGDTATSYIRDDSDGEPVLRLVESFSSTPIDTSR